MEIILQKTQNDALKLYALTMLIPFNLKHSSKASKHESISRDVWIKVYNYMKQSLELD